MSEPKLNVLSNGYIPPKDIQGILTFVEYLGIILKMGLYICSIFIEFLLCEDTKLNIGDLTVIKIRFLILGSV